MGRSNEFSDIVQKSLEGHSSSLKEVLKRFISFDYDPAVKFLQFEVFPDEFTDSFPVMGFFFDADWAEFLVKVKVKPDKPLGLSHVRLLSIDHVYPQELEDEFADDLVAEGTDPWSLSVEVLTKWFANCWREEGGHQCKLQAFIAPHDSFFLLDLNKNLRLKQTDIRPTP